MAAVAGTAGGALAVRVVRSTDELDALQPAWSAMHAQASGSVFQSYEWQRTWWKHLGGTDPARRLHVVVLEANGEVVAIAPFFIEVVRIAPFLTLRRLAFLGSGLTDHLDLLVKEGLEARCCDEVASHLAQENRAFDVLSLSDIPDSSPSRSLLFDALRVHGFEGKAFVAEQCPRTLLKSTWKETLETFEGRHRREVGRRMRQMHKQFRVELDICRDARSVGADIDEFMAMHQRRWTAAARKGVYADAPVAAFQREIAQLFFARGWLFLAFLRLDGRRVAAICAFKHADVIAHYLSGLAIDDLPEARKLSPGIVLCCLGMQELIPQGIRVYDFLRGIETYKYECGAVDVPNWALLMSARGGRWAKAKNVIALLEESLARRLQQEKLAFRQHRRAHGFFSAATARYLWGRGSIGIRDGMKKLRSPEKSLTAGETGRA